MEALTEADMQVAALTEVDTQVAEASIEPVSLVVASSPDQITVAADSATLLNREMVRVPI